jgi:hypothetical protein
VIQITSIDDLLLTRKTGTVNTFTRLAASGAGLQTAYTIPDGKRLTIWAIHIKRTGGNGTITALRIDDLVNFFTQSAAGDCDTLLLDQPLVLDAGQWITLSVDSISTDTTWQTRLYYEEEDITLP